VTQHDQQAEALQILQRRPYGSLNSVHTQSSNVVHEMHFNPFNTDSEKTGIWRGLHI